MNLVKKISLLIPALLLMVGFNVSQAADISGMDLKVATVDVQKVLEQSSKVASLSKKLEDKFKGRQGKIGDLQKALQAKIEQFKKDEPTMSKKERDTTEKKLSDERADLIKQVVAYQQDLQKEQAGAMQGIMSDLNNVVSNIAKTQKYALVLNSQAVIFATNQNDITSDVAKEFNS